MKKLDEIEARLKAASPGPWKWDGTVWEYDKNEEAPWLIGKEESKILWGEIHSHKRNADFIAHSPTDIAYLLKIARAAMELDRASFATALGIHNHGDMCQVELCNALAKFREAVVE